LDCLIVRIMKAHRVMQHNDLVVQVMKENKTFESDVRTIKRRIENLIERDYIERDQSSYKYIL
jgi:cullin 1